MGQDQRTKRILQDGGHIAPPAPAVQRAAGPAQTGGFLRTLSGRLLILTVIFVMLAEVLIFVPSIARFRADFLTMRLEKAQIAALAQLAAADMVTPELEAELLANAEVFNVVLRRNEVRELVLSSQLPQPISQTYDLRSAGPWVLIRDAFSALLGQNDGIIRVIGQPVQGAGLLIEITMAAQPLRAALIDYGGRILLLSAVISAITAFMLFLAVQRLIVGPIRRVVRHMQAYAEAPEDARSLIAPTSRVEELRRAEEAMQMMQTQLTSALRQRERLAQLGGAVAKISHDLRNILTSAQLFVDRIEASQDPAVARAAPKLVGSISRAVALCESTLTFGRAEEAAPQPRRVDIAALATEVAESDGIGPDTPVTLALDIPQGLQVWADVDQLYRVLSNLIRNARQAIEAQGGVGGVITVSAGQTPLEYWVVVADTGPGLPARARTHLFEAFAGGARKGGTGLGLAIAAELLRGHGGRLELMHSTPQGTAFILHLPQETTRAD
jgi:signal transduction histidine kinase